MSEAPNVAPILTNPLAPPAAADEASQGPYDVALAMGQELRDKPRSAPTRVQVGTQHGKGRMTVWERIDTLKDPGDEPTILFQNWGKNLDGASIVTGVTKVNGRDTAFYGHDFTVRAGSMDATNGRKLANEGVDGGASCVSCHGVDGNAPIIDTYPKLGGQYADYIAHSLQAYRSGDRSGSATTDLMAVQAKDLSDQQIADLAAYFGGVAGQLKDLHGAN